LQNGDLRVQSLIREDDDEPRNLKLRSPTMNASPVQFEEQLASCSTPIERITLLNKTAWDVCRLDTIRSMKLSQEALEIAREINYHIGEIKAFLTLAQCYWLLGDYLKAIDYLDKLMPQLNEREHLREMAEALNLFGSVYSSMDKLVETHEYFKEALVLRETIGDGEGIARTMNSIGDTLMKQSRYEEALKMFLKTKEIDHSNETYKGIILYNIAEAEFNLKRYEACKESIEKCMEIGENLKFPLMIIYSKSLLAKIKIHEENLTAAEELLITCLQLAGEIKNVERITQIYLDLSKVNELSGNLAQAFRYFKQYQELKDSHLIRESNERLKAIEHRAELEASRKETERQKLRNDELHAANITNEAVKNALTDKNREITDSIKYAKQIQQALLPSDELVNALFPDNFILYKPKDILSGDFYWVSGAQTKHFETIAMASVVDCTGHGVPGALMSIIGNSFLRVCEHEPTVNRPSEALDFINAGISNTLRQEYSKSKIRDGMDMAFIAVDYAKMLVHYAGAKNPMYLIRKGELHEYKGDKHPVGAFVGEEMLKFTNHSIPIEKGDCVYLFTDGYPDQFGGPKGKKFMYKNFRELILTNSHLPMNEQLAILDSTFEEWKGNLEQIDDVCLMGIRI
jgi:serine phosphatase RsbU (regulator of sigma subunit)